MLLTYLQSKWEGSQGNWGEVSHYYSLLVLYVLSYEGWARCEYSLACDKLKHIWYTDSGGLWWSSLAGFHCKITNGKRDIAVYPSGFAVKLSFEIMNGLMFFLIYTSTKSEKLHCNIYFVVINLWENGGLKIIIIGIS